MKGIRRRSGIFCLGDLGDNNIFVSSNSVGIIDFNESGYLDKATDFMDINNEVIIGHVLDLYGADEALRSKVAPLRTKIRPVLALHFHMLKKDESGMMRMIDQIKTNFC